MLALLGALNAAAATDDAEPAATDDSEQSAVPPQTDPERNQRTLFEYLRHPDWQPLHSLLIDQEMPVVGIRWGAELQFDTPLNQQPDDAEAALREARLKLYRALGRNFFAKVELNYNNAGQFEIGDTYLIYSGAKTFTTSAGFFRPPFSLDTMSKRAGLTFMERSMAVDALSERRSGGLTLLKRTPSSIFNVGLFLYSPDDEGQREKGQAVVMRYVLAPLASRPGLGFLGGRDIWAGVSFSYRINAKGPNTQFRSRPEVAFTDEYFVDTGPIDGANSIYRIGVEASKVAGPVSWQAELLTTKVERDNASSVDFIGGYFLASWFLTGESRNYSSASGEFLPVVPDSPVFHGGWGAWEIAARASAVDLTDKDVVGGRQRNLSLGVNWYLNKSFRVQANLIKVLDVRRPGSPYDGADPWIAGLRVQYYLR